MFQRGWLKKGEFARHKRPKQKKKIETITTNHMKLLKNGFLGDGVENIYNIHF
jgi:hypothetical protein